MVNQPTPLVHRLRIFLLCLCLCSLVAFLFAQNEHFERDLNSPLDLIHHFSQHLERENHVGSLNAALIPWDGTQTVIIHPPFIRNRLRLRSVAVSPQLPPPKFQLG